MQLQPKLLDDDSSGVTGQFTRTPELIAPASRLDV